MKNITDYLKVFKNINKGPRITAQEPRNTELAKAEIPRHLWDNVNTPDLEQSPDSFLRPGETLEDWDTSFRKPNAEGGRIGYDDGQLVRNTVDGSRPGRLGFNDGKLVKTGPNKGKYKFRYGASETGTYKTFYGSPEEGKAWLKKQSTDFQWLKKGTSIEDVEKRIVELGKTGEHTKAEIHQLLKDEGYVKPSKIDTVPYRAAKSRINTVLTTAKIKVPTITDIQGNVLMKLVKEHPKVDTIQGIAELAQKELNLKKLPYQKVKRWAKANKIKLLTIDEKIFPEIKALDKLVKKKIDNFENIQKGFGNQYVSGGNNPNAISKALHSEMKKLGFDLTPNQLSARLVKLDSLYSGKLEPGTAYAADIYKEIKPIKNYANSKFKKGFFATVKSSGFTSVIQDAQMLGLPDKDIALLRDVFAGSRQLSTVKIAGDHTDSSALMRAVLNEKNWKQYKKDFMRINIISNTLNKAKLPFDKTISDAYKDWKNKVISQSEFNAIVQDTKTALLKKTKIPIGNPKIVNGEFQFNFLTERMGDLKNPRNKAVLSAMNNLVKQSGVEFKGIDQELMFTNTGKERFNILRNAGIDQLKQSKYIKAFSKMGGKVGKAAKLIIAGGAGATAVATVANASETGVIDKAKSFPVEHPWLTAGGAGVSSLAIPAVRKAVGTALNLGFGPTGAAALIYGLRPEGGYDLSKTGDRIGFEAEASFASPLVKGALSVTDKIKNPMLRKIAERGSLALMSPAMALRFARVATPLGIASLAGEGLWHLGKKGYSEHQKMKGMTEQEKSDYLAQRYEDLGGVYGEGAADGGRIGRMGGGMVGIRKPHAIPPEKQGLRSIMINGKKS